MRTCACVLETYVRTDSTIYIYKTARLIIEHHREWLASLADNGTDVRKALLEIWYIQRKENSSGLKLFSQKSIVSYIYYYFDISNKAHL